jgi:hypothetical protein
MKAVAAVTGLACLLFAVPGYAIPYVHDDFSQLLVNLNWSIGERGTEVSVQYGVDSAQSGYLKVSEVSSGNFQLMEGRVSLSPEEILQLRTLESAADFSSFREDIGSAPDRKDAQGNTIVTICYSGFSIAERNSKGEFHIVDRQCLNNEREPKLMNYAQSLVRMAQMHFPDLATSPGWKEELQ